MEDPHGKCPVVTGIGVISPLGNGLQALVDGIREARTGIREISAFDTSPFRTPFGGEALDFDPTERLSQEEIETLDDRYLQLALASARQALEHAKMSWSRETPPPPRTGLVVGTCNGGLLTAQRQYEFLSGLSQGSLDRKMNLLIRYHACGKALTHHLGIGGPAWVLSTACSSSTCALGLARELISAGIVDTVLAGGADALCMATLAGFDSIKATSTGRTAPFSLPPGLNLGEGAAFWVVESEEKARERGAEIFARILGYSFTADAYHPTAPDPRGDGQWRTMTQALEEAGTTVSQLGCINLHGTGTEANDRVESRTVRKLTGDLEVPCYSFKSQVGHCLGAGGVLEATAGVVAMNDDIVPATINFTEPRPGCDLDYVPNEPRAATYDRFLSSNYAFGGHNAAVVVGGPRCEAEVCGEPKPRRETVITGAGAVSSLGLGARALLDGLREGRRGIGEVGDRVKGETTSRMGGLVPEFEARDVDRRLDFRSLNTISRYATAAARLTMGDAGLRVSPKAGLETGVVNGIYVGTSEEEYMFAVTRSGGAEADIGSFSAIVPNATGGWISNILALKGYSCTVTMGADAGLFAMAMSHLAIGAGTTRRVLCGGADELFSRYYMNYDELGLLHTGDDELEYRIRPGADRRRTLGEGAAYVVAEERESAEARGAKIVARVAGIGQTTSTERFLETDTDAVALAGAIRAALENAGWSPKDVGLATWAPQGNSRDLVTLDGMREALGERFETLPVVTSVFHTGLAEASSGVMALAAIVEAWSSGEGLWPQKTGIDEIDSRPLPDGPVRTLLVTSGELGFNLVIAVEPAEGVGR